MSLRLIGNTVYVSNLSKTVREKDVYRKFSEFGKVRKVTIVTDPVNK